MFPGLYKAEPVWNPGTGRSGLAFVILNPSDEHGYDTTHLPAIWWPRSKKL